MPSSSRAFRIDAESNHLLLRSANPPQPPQTGEATLPEPLFPQYPELLSDPGPVVPPEKRHWNGEQIMRKVRGWLVPYVRSRVMPGEFHPITAYLFVEYKCNLDCWYCWSFDNKVKGMTEDVARRAIDWLHDHGCRVLALMGGEPLLRPEFVHKVVYYAAKRGFWIYIATNGRLLRPDIADRLGDAGVAVFNFALDAWDEKPGLPKALVPARKNLEHVMRKQYVYGYLVFFNMNVCRNNLEDIRLLTEYAHEHRLATDYHLNETPMIEQDAHFKHLDDNPTYIRPEDWPAVDELIDWIIARNQAGYQMVNSVARLQQMKVFMRMFSGENPDLQFEDWNCRAGQNNVVVRTGGTLTPCFPLYSATYDWGSLDGHRFDSLQLREMKKTCQKHCFSTLNHNLGYCYNDRRVIKFLWQQLRNGLKGGARSFED